MNKKQAGRRGGKAKTEKQQAQRRLALYRWMAKRWPHSVQVRRKLKEQEKIVGKL